MFCCVPRDRNEGNLPGTEPSSLESRSAIKHSPQSITRHGLLTAEQGEYNTNNPSHMSLWFAELHPDVSTNSTTTSIFSKGSSHCPAGKCWGLISPQVPIHFGTRITSNTRSGLYTASRINHSSTRGV